MTILTEHLEDTAEKQQVNQNLPDGGRSGGSGTGVSVEIVGSGESAGARPVVGSAVVHPAVSAAARRSPRALVLVTGQHERQHDSEVGRWLRTMGLA